MTNTLESPCLSLLLLFREPQANNGNPTSLLVRHLNLTAETGEQEEQAYRGVLEETILCQVRARLAHDTLVLRCDLALEGGNSIPTGWERLTPHAEALLDHLAENSATAPWAATWLYHAVLPPGRTPDSAPDWLSAFSLPVAPALETTPYGWFAVLSDDGRARPGGIGWRERRLLLLVPQERLDRVARYFLHPLTQGWARIERHLHKALHHARLQQEISHALAQGILRLRAEMSAAVSTMDFANLYRESQELEQVSVALMALLNQKAHAEMVLQSLRINLHDFSLALEEVKLSTPAYERERQRLSQCIEQLQSDLEYARVTTESTYAFQEMQRGIENNRLQRASLMLGTAAALLAGITIFNSFLDIWALILQDSAWVLPPMGVRMAIGLLAGVSLPLATYWVIERRRAMAVLWGVLGLFSFALAVFSTLWVNR
ncbi:MAG: hypothetical protein Fur0043_23530 [Anaerolineales bacterium]